MTTEDKIKPETPKQYESRTEEKLNPNTIVWFISPKLPSWDYMEYFRVKGVSGVVMIIADSNGKPDVDYESREVL